MSEQIIGPDGEVLWDAEASHQQLRNELQEARADQRAAERSAEIFAYELLSQLGGDQPDLDIKDRRRFADQAKKVWERDPQAGAAVDLLNDFTFGRGVPKPRARNPEVQKAIDEAWDDPDNQLVLTGYQAQIAFGTDLTLQSNVFFLMFDDGDDGKVKLATLPHHSVEEVVRDPDNRLRILWYVTRQKKREWDFEKDQWKIQQDTKPAKVEYYGHWRNVRDADERGADIPRPPDRKIGEGRVYHVAINRTSEQAFGVPTMRRLLKWFSAYNEFMASRVDLTKAAAQFIMKRRVRGGPDAVQRMAAKQLSRSGELGATGDNEPIRPAGVLTENDALTHEAFNLPTNSANAQQDGQMIRSQISAATRFPQHYLGDAGTANLATATAMELPVLKAVEARQEIFEGVYRWFIDRVIERAVETGRVRAPREMEREYPYSVGEQAEDEAEHDLSYDFSMPSPLRRMMGELITGIAEIARTFDPNGTNLELTKSLLTIALGEGLEVENPAKAVERIFPEGYEDPALTALKQQAEMGVASQANPRGSGSAVVPPDHGTAKAATSKGADGKKHKAGNPYGARQEPDSQKRNSQKHMKEAAVFNRAGEVIGLIEEGTRFDTMPGDVRENAKTRMDALERQFDMEIGDILAEELAAAEGILVARNGNGNGNGKT